jgi:cytochrome b subunit of formate dehydrogenase
MTEIIFVCVGFEWGNTGMYNKLTLIIILNGIRHLEKTLIFTLIIAFIFILVTGVNLYYINRIFYYILLIQCDWL